MERYLHKLTGSELHHKIVLQNDYLRILNGRISFNDTTVFHSHSAQSIVVFLSASTFGISIKGEKPVIADVKPGDMRYVPMGQNQLSIPFGTKANLYFILW